MVQVRKDNQHIMNVVVGIISLIIFFLNPPLSILFFALLGGQYYLNLRVEGEIQKTFPVCPLCGSNKIEATLGLGFKDDVACKTCGAEWKLFVDPIGKIRWVRLITPSKYGGAGLTGTNKSTDFWISLSKRKYPDLWQNSLKEFDRLLYDQPDLKSLTRIIQEHIEEGDAAYGRGNYTSATKLYFLALAGITDYVLIKGHGKKAENHNERFKLLEAIDPLLYRTTSKFFSIYRKAYSEEIPEKECRELRDTVFSLVRRYSIPIKLPEDVKSVKSIKTETETLETKERSIEESYRKERAEKIESPDNSIQDIKIKLRELKDLYEEGLITEEEYVEKRKELVSKL